MELTVLYFVVILNFGIVLSSFLSGTVSWEAIGTPPSTKVFLFKSFVTMSFTTID